MNYRRVLAISVAIATVAVSGYLAGSAVATNDSDAPSRVEVLPPSQQNPVNDWIVLDNGKTAGSWSLTTPAAERPDYMPVALDDGTEGYAKVSDFNDGLVFPELEPGEVGELPEGALDRAEYNRKHVMIQPNGAGEIWVPVYARDGITVIGKKMMDDGR